MKTSSPPRRIAPPPPPLAGRAGAGARTIDSTTLLRLGGLCVLAAWIWWDASVSPSRLGSLGGLLLVLLAAGLVALRREIGPLDRARAALLGAAAAFVAWNYLSLLWADAPAAAWHGANRALVYAAALALFALWPWRERDLVLTVGIVATLVGASALAVAVRILVSPSPGELIEEGRLALPTGYANASAALWTMGALLALPLAARRAAGPWPRSLALGGATLSLGLAVLAQSRGWLFTLPVAVALLLALGRERLRLVLAAALAAAGVAAVSGPLTGVFGRYADGEAVGGAARRAVLLLVAASAAVAVAGLVWWWLDRRVAPGERARRAIAIAVAVALALGLAGGVAAGWRAVGDPGAWIEEKWHDFTTGPAGETSGSRLSGTLATDRYQEWRIAAAEFADHPALGIGADNYTAAYLLRRDDNRFLPVHPHSTPLRHASQLGIVGLSLFAALAVLVIVLGVRRRRSSGPATAAAVGSALAVFCYWLVAGSFDVFWETPTLAFLAFALGGIAAAPARPDAGDRSGRRQGLSRRAAFAAAAVLLVGAGSLFVTAASYAFLESGRAAGASEAARAYSRLDTAAALNPLSALPLTYKGLIALEAGDVDLARTALADAVDREPNAWFPAALAGLTAASAGDTEAAAADIARAQALNPRDPLLEIAARLLAAGEPLDVGLFVDLYLDGLNRESVEWLAERYFQDLPPRQPPSGGP